MATTRFHDHTPDVDVLYADLAAADLQPLWTQPGLLTRTPDRLRPHIWRWKTLRDLAERSGDLVGIDRGGDRRVLSLSHPDLGPDLARQRPGHPAAARPDPHPARTRRLLRSGLALRGPGRAVS